jgi:DNA-binding GntR family transcriptional regulator
MSGNVLPLDRSNLSEPIIQRLREMIVQGRLGAGARINEVHMAASLGVSRTPLREALAKLEVEGAVRCIPRIGYSVMPLSIEEFRRIYPIRALLDPEALRLAGIPSAARLDKLEAMNRKIVSALTPEQILRRDDEWHLELLAECPNSTLIALIEQFIRCTRRYELALMREQSAVDRAVHDHDQITTALRNHNLRRACKALRLNMQSGEASIIAWLIKRQSRSD